MTLSFNQVKETVHVHIAEMGTTTCEISWSLLKDPEGITLASVWEMRGRKRSNHQRKGDQFRMRGLHQINVLSLNLLHPPHLHLMNLLPWILGTTLQSQRTTVFKWLPFGARIGMMPRKGGQARDVRQGFCALTYSTPNMLWLTYSKVRALYFNFCTVFVFAVPQKEQKGTDSHVLKLIWQESKMRPSLTDEFLYFVIHRIMINRGGLISFKGISWNDFFFVVITVFSTNRQATNLTVLTWNASVITWHLSEGNSLLHRIRLILLQSNKPWRTRILVTCLFCSQFVLYPWSTFLSCCLLVERTKRISSRYLP